MVESAVPVELANSNHDLPKGAVRRWLGVLALGGLLCGLFFGSGCFARVGDRCPSCHELRIGERPPVPAGTRTVFLLIPGMLGYGWEWDGAQAALARYPQSAVLVYSWEPWRSLSSSSARLEAHLEYLQHRLPPSVRELFVIAHSVGGLIAIEAAGSLRGLSIEAPESEKAGARERPPLRIHLLSVGAPLAGMGRNPWGGKDMWYTPLPIALGGYFTHWPEPAPGVSLEIYPTSDDDPVMRRVLSHDPGDVRVLPRRAHLHSLPRALGHNNALTWLCQYLLEQAPTS